MGFGVSRFGFRAEGFGVDGSGFEIWIIGIGASGPDRLQPPPEAKRSRCSTALGQRGKVGGSEFRAQGLVGEGFGMEVRGWGVQPRSVSACSDYVVACSAEEMAMFVKHYRSGFGFEGLSPLASKFQSIVCRDLAKPFCLVGTGDHKLLPFQ